MTKRQYYINNRETGFRADRARIIAVFLVTERQCYINMKVCITRIEVLSIMQSNSVVFPFFFSKDSEVSSLKGAATCLKGQ